MAESKEFKWEESFKDLLDQVLEGLDQLVSLKITTMVGPVGIKQVEKDGKPTDKYTVVYPENPRVLHSDIDLLQGDITTVYELPGLDSRQLQDDARLVLVERLAGFGERYPDVTVHQVVVSDQPARQLVERAKDAQLVVVGSHGRGGFAGMLLGSVSTAVVHAVRTPTIVARES